MKDIGSWVERKSIEASRRGLPEDYKYNIAFAGIGDVAEAAVNAIINSSYTDFAFPIGKIYLVGRDNSESEARREQLIRESKPILKGKTKNTRFPYNIDFLSKTYEDLAGEVLRDTDIYFFTADANEELSDRVSLTKNNLKIIRDHSKYFIGSNFKGIINIVSNLPEALAHEAALSWNLPDPRQITAHTPLDKNRADSLLEDLLNEAIPIGDTETHQILQGIRFENIDYFLVGHHDSINLIFSGAMLSLGEHRTGINLSEWFIDISDFLHKYVDIVTLPSKLKEYAPEQFRLQDKRNENKIRELEEEIQQLKSFSKIIKHPEKIKILEGKISNLKIRRIATIHSTGASIRDYVQAVINRDYTTTGVLFPIKGENYFVDLPVTFYKGYAVPDLEKLSRMTDIEKNDLENRIVGDFSDKKDTDRSLKQVIESTSGKYQKISIPNSTKKIDNMMNPKGLIPHRENDKVIFVGGSQGFLQKFLGTGQTEESMKHSLKESIDAELVIPSSISNRTITKYRLNHTLVPSVSEYTLSISEKDMIKARIENAKIDMSTYWTNGNTVLALSRRSHASRPTEYRLHKFDMENGGKEQISEVISSKFSDFNISEVILSDKIYLLMEENGKTHVNTFDFENGHLKKIISETDITKIFKYDTSIGFIEGNKVYGLKSGKPKLINTLLDVPESTWKFTQDEKIVFYDSVNKDSIVAEDLHKGITKSFDTLYNSFDFVETKGGGIQIATLHTEGIRLTNFESANHLLDKKGEKIDINEPSLAYSSIHLPQKDVIIALNEPDDCSIIYTMKGNTYIQKINEITKFTELGAVNIKK